MTFTTSNEGEVISIPIDKVVAWTQGKAPNRLFLPPIQRSIVWKNQQIVNYWDSLLRGYPAGLMMVNKPNQSVARTTEGQTCEIRPEDFELFDGQQRLTTILLGFQAGQLEEHIKLWVDLGMDPSADSGLLFQLRISSTGQPFGYQPHWPNIKYDLKKRRDKVAAWIENEKTTQFSPIDAFAKVKGKDLIGIDVNDPGPIQLHEIISLIAIGERHATETLISHWNDIDPTKIIKFVYALDRALKLPVPFQLVNQSVVENGQEYIRFFGRLGQGGTALSNDELTYSIIKHQYPHVHDCIKNITRGPAGRVTSEVNLVLAALRVAKVLAPWEGAKEWELVGRPVPGFVSRLKDFPKVGEEFRRMISSPLNGGLNEYLETIHRRLFYDKTKNNAGLPPILMARLPHQLIDVLLLMTGPQNQDKSALMEPDWLPSFALHWLLFVKDHDKAADHIFRRYRSSPDINSQAAIQDLIRDFEAADIAWRIPSKRRLPNLREDIKMGNHRLRTGPERFACLDTESVHKCADALRVLSGDRELIKRALLWLQRDYLAHEFGYYNPTSGRDEDLPIDLDHLIPDSIFGFNWNSASMRPEFADPDENFYWQRKPIGNSLGNFHWLDAQKNRSRGADSLVLVPGDLVQDPEPWNHLIKTSPWKETDVASFQKLIDLRTIDIYESLLADGNLELLIPQSEALADSTVANP